jgi:pimeloyl-ACP methyl ester carboxylesterase
MTGNASPSPAAVRAHPADRFLCVDGARLRYRDEGHGPPVLLVHGWTLDLEMWDPQVRGLRDTFRLVRLDRRGFGLSGGIPAADRDGADLRALCRHLGINRVALVGMSQGARSALDFATAAPAQIRAIVLDGPPPPESAAADEDVPLARYRARIASDGIEAFRREWARHPLTQLHTHDERTHALLAAILERYTGADLCSPNPSPPSSDMRTCLASLTAPALILNGELDLASRLQAAERLGELLPTAQRALIAAAGHLPNLDNPDAYNALCRAFLSRYVH